jgi:hypothetical protein
MKVTTRLLKQLIREALQDNLAVLRDLKYTKNKTPADHVLVRKLYAQAQQDNDVVTMQYIEDMGINLGEYLFTEDFMLKALKDFIAETPALANDEAVIEHMEDHDYEVQNNSQLVLGTIKWGGGDRLYNLIAAVDPGFKNLLTKIHDYAIKFGKPVKRPRKFGVIPYTDYKWNEDAWGEEL